MNPSNIILIIKNQIKKPSHFVTCIIIITIHETFYGIEIDFHERKDQQGQKPNSVWPYHKCLFLSCSVHKMNAGDYESWVKNLR